MYTIDLRANSEKNRVQRLEVSANPGRWTIDRVRMPRGGDRVMTVDFRYGRIDTFWLPAEVVGIVPDGQDSTETSGLTLLRPCVEGQVPRTGRVTLIIGLSVSTRA